LASQPAISRLNNQVDKENMKQLQQANANKLQQMMLAYNLNN
jgi:hypothetical protein